MGGSCAFTAQTTPFLLKKVLPCRAKLWYWKLRAAGLQSGSGEMVILVRGHCITHLLCSWTTTISSTSEPPSAWMLIKCAITKFDFTLSYQPRSKNTKADSLSHMFSSPNHLWESIRTWVHITPATGYPGTQKTHEALCAKYTWAEYALWHSPLHLIMHALHSSQSTTNISCQEAHATAHVPGPILH